MDISSQMFSDLSPNGSNLNQMHEGLKFKSPAPKFEAPRPQPNLACPQSDRRDFWPVGPAALNQLTGTPSSCKSNRVSDRFIPLRIKGLARNLFVMSNCQERDKFQSGAKPTSDRVNEDSPEICSNYDAMLQAELLGQMASTGSNNYLTPHQKCRSNMLKYQSSAKQDPSYGFTASSACLSKPAHRFCQN